MAWRWRRTPRTTTSGDQASLPDADLTPQWVFDSPDEYDMPAEVDASVRTLRRVAIGHFAVFFGAVLLVPFLTLALDWWSKGRLFGGMSPNFAMAAFGLYVFFFAISIAAARLANAVEDRMLGGSNRDPARQDGEPS